MEYLIGFHAILEALKTKPAQARILLATGKSAPKQGPRIREIIDFARNTGLRVESVDTALLDRIDLDHRGVILELRGDSAEKSVSLDEFLSKPKEESLVLILDHIEDPQNFGAILRSADAFGVDLIIAPLRRAAPLSDSVAKASAGATAWVPIAFVQNLADAIRKLQSEAYWVYASDMSGEALSSISLAKKTCFIMGNEGAGVSRLLLERADGTVSIPMVGHVESLNVSVASALLMYEYRARLKGPRYP